MTRETLSDRKLMRIAGVCGIASVVIAGVAESLAIYYSSGFSFTDNWLSDLGGLSYAAFLNVPRSSVSSPATILLGQGGLIIAGLLAIIFAFGLLKQADSPVHRLGAAFGFIGTIGLFLSGVLPAPTGLPHLIAVYTFGLLAPTAMLLIGSTFVTSKIWLAGLLITLGIVALAGTSMISYGRSIAELILLATVALWAITLSVMMLQQRA